KGMDGATITFALSNILANGINIMFGAERAKDPHQLDFLKKHFNDELNPHLPNGQELPGLKDQRIESRKEPEAPKTLGEKTRDFMQRNSVRLGEIGLRYFGSLALVLPTKNWGKGWEALKKEGIKEAFNVTKNADKFTR